MNNNSNVNRGNQDIVPFNPMCSFIFEDATKYANILTKSKYYNFGYATAMPVTQEMVDNNEANLTEFVLGEWYRTNRFDPRIVAMRKAGEIPNGY